MAAPRYFVPKGAGIDVEIVSDSGLIIWTREIGSVEPLPPLAAWASFAERFVERFQAAALTTPKELDAPKERT